MNEELQTAPGAGIGGLQIRRGFCTRGLTRESHLFHWASVGEKRALDSSLDLVTYLFTRLPPPLNWKDNAGPYSDSYKNSINLLVEEPRAGSTSV